MPKNIDLARDPMKDDILADAEITTPDDLSIRQQGRLRHKKALLAKLHKGESGNDEPEPKKVRQVHAGDEDVAE